VGNVPTPIVIKPNDEHRIGGKIKEEEKCYQLKAVFFSNSFL